MFTWICPQCGREVPPSYTECPGCAAAAAKPPASEAVVPEPAGAPATPAAAPVPPRPAGAHQLPAWLMTIVFFLAFAGLAACIFWGYNYYRGVKTGPVPVTAMEPTTRSGAKPHPLQKYLEVAGMRFIGDKKETTVRFLLVNHSEAEIANLAATVTVWARTQRSEEEPVGTLTFKLVDIGPNESKEVSAPLTTRLKIYELPDWQNVTTEIQVTSPAAQ